LSFVPLAVSHDSTWWTSVHVSALATVVAAVATAVLAVLTFFYVRYTRTLTDQVALTKQQLSLLEGEQRAALRERLDANSPAIGVSVSHVSYTDPHGVSSLTGASFAMALTVTVTNYGRVPCMLAPGPGRWAWTDLWLDDRKTQWLQPRDLSPTENLVFCVDIDPRGVANDIASGFWRCTFGLVAKSPYSKVIDHIVWSGLVPSPPGPIPVGGSVSAPWFQPDFQVERVYPVEEPGPGDG
jgi:hypothetical protein